MRHCCDADSRLLRCCALCSGRCCCVFTWPHVTLIWETSTNWSGVEGIASSKWCLSVYRAHHLIVHYKTLIKGRHGLNDWITSFQWLTISTKNSAPVIWAKTKRKSTLECCTHIQWGFFVNWELILGIMCKHIRLTFSLLPLVHFYLTRNPWNNLNAKKKKEKNLAGL